MPERYPGVFPEEPGGYEGGGITGVPTSVLGFVGPFTKGPVDDPQLVASFGQVLEIFGSYVADWFSIYALQAFFDNATEGGMAWVVRSTHHDSNGATTAEDATRDIPDQLAVDTLQVDATNEGVWGQDIKVVFHDEDDPVRTLLSTAENAGDNQIHVNSVDGFEPGMCICIGIQYPEYHVIQSVSVGDRIIRTVAVLTNAHPVRDRVQVVEFQMDVYYLGEIKEQWTHLSMCDDAPNFVENVINDEFTGSNFVFVTDLDSASGSPNDRPNFEVEYQLQGGDNGLVGLDYYDLTYWSLRSLNPVADEVGILAIPDLVGLATPQYGVDLMLTWCETNIVFGLHDIPYGYTAQQARTYVQDVGAFSSRQGGIYWPFYEQYDPLTNSGKWMPESGAMAGVYARTDAVRGVHKAPAGNQAKVYGARKLEVDVDDNIQSMVFNQRVNCIRKRRAVGIVCWGARTLSGSKKWRYVNVSRFFNYAEKSISQSILWAVFEPNLGAGPWGIGLRGILVRDITNFLLLEWRKGALRGAKQSDAFQVICDESNNTVLDEDNGDLWVDIYLAVSKPAEFIHLRFRHKEGVVTIA